MIEIAIALGAMALSLAGLLISHLRTINRLQERVSKLETKIDVFWQALEKYMADKFASDLNPDSEPKKDKPDPSNKEAFSDKRVAFVAANLPGLMLEAVKAFSGG